MIVAIWPGCNGRGENLMFWEIGDTDLPYCYLLTGVSDRWGWVNIDESFSSASHAAKVVETPGALILWLIKVIISEICLPRLKRAARTSPKCLIELFDDYFFENEWVIDGGNTLIEGKEFCSERPPTTLTLLAVISSPYPSQFFHSIA